jgi:RNA polymerase III transcription factor (TF)IIIC subunit HTH domain
VEEVRNQYDQALIQRLEEVGSSRLCFTYLVDSVIIRKLFRTRPVWTRAALLNQFTPAQAREIHK